MAEVKSAPTTKVITGTVRLSYAHVWEPVAIEEGAPKKYSAALIIPKSDKETVSKIKAAIESAKEEGKVKLGGKIPASLKTPLRDGDVDREGDENYAGCYFINANSTNKPGIVDKNKQEILDREEVYSGCFVKASITFYAFNTSGNKGIACGLNHIMKVKDGEPLGGRSRAEDDFADVEVEDDDDLMG
jgi:hypothetical protein